MSVTASVVMALGQIGRRRVRPRAVAALGEYGVYDPSNQGNIA